MAGYIDAEGSFGLNQRRGRFKIDSYDFRVLREIRDFLFNQGIKVKFYCIVRKGTRKKRGKGVWNNNLWRLTVNEGRSLKCFIELVLLQLRHEKRKKDAKKCLENIKIRIKNGTIR